MSRRDIRLLGSPLFKTHKRHIWSLFKSNKETVVESSPVVEEVSKPAKNNEVDPIPAYREPTGADDTEWFAQEMRRIQRRLSEALPTQNYIGDKLLFSPRRAYGDTDRLIVSVNSVKSSVISDVNVSLDKRLGSYSIVDGKPFLTNKHKHVLLALLMKKKCHIDRLKNDMMLSKEVLAIKSLVGDKALSKRRKKIVNKILKAHKRTVESTGLQVDEDDASSTFKNISVVRLKNPSLPVPYFIGRYAKPLEIVEAIRAVKESAMNQKQSVDVVIKLSVDPKKGDQQVRGVVQLPHGNGKEAKICVFAPKDIAEMALEAGADAIGNSTTVQEILKGNVPYEKILATADMMSTLTPVARILGPKNMMPNMKLGTIVTAATVTDTIKDIKKGRAEFRIDRGANLHVNIGKTDFTDEQLTKNLIALLEKLLEVRPKVCKGKGMSGYVQKIIISATYGRATPISLNSITPWLDGNK